MEDISKEEIIAAPANIEPATPDLDGQPPIPSPTVVDAAPIDDDLPPRPTTSQQVEEPQSIETPTPDVSETVPAPNETPVDQVIVETDEIDEPSPKDPQLVSELEAQVEELKSQLTASSTLDAVAITGPKLSHATKSRVNPRKPVKREPETSSTVEANIDAAPTTPTATTPTDPADDLKKKIAVMGGVSALGGFNPFAGGSAPLLKSRVARTGSSSSQDLTEFAEAAEHEDEIVAWVNEKTGDVVEKGLLHEMLKDGHVLCKLVSAVHPEGKVTKVKAGKFAFIYQENVNNYLSASEQLGVAKNMKFEYQDLTDPKGTPRVLAHLLALKKVIEK
ncbi:calponin homology domain-containing protein [Chytridium lagenaria]|nr:calponin homology domain-containing protein [Chytridium lagenaria]